MRILVFGLALAGCHRPVEHLSELRGVDTDQAGKRLVALPYGLHRLDPDETGPLTVIGVHGFRSEGSEWVDPLLMADDTGAEIYFYRWNTLGCPDGALPGLIEAITRVTNRDPAPTSLVVMGHSYGGLLSSLAAQKASLPIPVAFEIVAAPLGPLPQLEDRCDFHGVPQQAPPEGTTWRQWRTVHEADGAFKDLETDPQRVELPGMSVVQLPETWEGGRLGHNRSLTWVAERRFGSSPTEEPATVEPTTGRCAPPAWFRATAVLDVESLHGLEVVEGPRLRNPSAEPVWFFRAETGPFTLPAGTVPWGPGEAGYPTDRLAEGQAWHYFANGIPMEGMEDRKGWQQLEGVDSVIPPLPSPTASPTGPGRTDDAEVPAPEPFQVAAWAGSGPITLSGSWVYALDPDYDPDACSH